jgi:hypothetical protein
LAEAALVAAATVGVLAVDKLLSLPAAALAMWGPRRRSWRVVRLVRGRARRKTARMACLLALLALISPRLVLFLLALFSNVLSRAFDSWLIPLLGFFLLPWTTLTYAAFWDWGAGHHVVGFEWFFVVLAFLIDLSSYGFGKRARDARA